MKESVLVFFPLPLLYCLALFRACHAAMGSDRHMIVFVSPRLIENIQEKVVFFFYYHKEVIGR